MEQNNFFAEIPVFQFFGLEIPYRAPIAPPFWEKSQNPHEDAVFAFCPAPASIKEVACGRRHEGGRVGFGLWPKIQFFSFSA